MHVHIFIDFPIYINVYSALGLVKFRQILPEKMKTRFQWTQTLQNTIESNIIFILFSFYSQRRNKFVITAKENQWILLYHETIHSVMTMLPIRH